MLDDGNSTEAARSAPAAIRLGADELPSSRVAEIAAAGAASIAHSIGNPLAGISCAVQLVASSFEAGDTRLTLLLRAQDEVTRLADVIGQLLAFAQEVRPRLADVDLAAVAALEAAVCGTPIEVSGAGTAHADEDLVGEVMRELIRNAVQAGASSVRIEVEPTGFRVLDDGPGVGADAAPRMFEPFFTTNVRGVGLGLSTVQRMVRAMGGSVAPCASSLGGAGFAVRLERSAA